MATKQVPPPQGSMRQMSYYEHALGVTGEGDLVPLMMTMQFGDRWDDDDSNWFPELYNFTVASEGITPKYFMNRNSKQQPAMVLDKLKKQFVASISYYQEMKNQDSDSGVNERDDLYNTERMLAVRYSDPPKKHFFKKSSAGKTGMYI